MTARDYLEKKFTAVLLANFTQQELEEINTHFDEFTIFDLSREALERKTNKAQETEE